MKKIKIEEINSIAKDMKYEALYWALCFEEKEKGLFVKSYDNQFIKETLEILDGFTSGKKAEEAKRSKNAL